jgi:hypothetical protein
MPRASAVLPENAIANSNLGIDDIPGVDATLQEIGRFARTFNAYEHWGSFAECAQVANSKRHATLSELRTCLFFEQRRWNHFGSEPDPEAQVYWRTLVRMIRAKVEGGELR